MSGRRAAAGSVCFVRRRTHTDTGRSRRRRCSKCENIYFADDVCCELLDEVVCCVRKYQCCFSCCTFSVAVVGFSCCRHSVQATLATLPPTKPSNADFLELLEEFTDSLHGVLSLSPSSKIKNPFQHYTSTCINAHQDYQL